MKDASRPLALSERTKPIRRRERYRTFLRWHGRFCENLSGMLSGPGRTTPRSSPWNRVRPKARLAEAKARPGMGGRSRPDSRNQVTYSRLDRCLRPVLLYDGIVTSVPACQIAGEYPAPKVASKKTCSNEF